MHIEGLTGNDLGPAFAGFCMSTVGIGMSKYLACHCVCVCVSGIYSFNASNRNRLFDEHAMVIVKAHGRRIVDVPFLQEETRDSCKA